MKRMMRRFALPTSLGLAAIALPAGVLPTGAQLASAQESEAGEESSLLTVGSKAPALDVEHWVVKPTEERPKVTNFEEGKVYVVEFWATWCGPCVASMPHLAETQKEYADKGVRIVSISNEELETVEKFLEREVPGAEEGEEKKTFRQLTSAYSLTTDPDQSSFEDYMQAAKQNGIPTAFLVGKTGLIEWIGHPMQMDEPLKEVVEGTWDREAFAAELAKEREFEELMQQVNAQFQEGEFDKALELVSGALKETDETIRTLQLASAVIGICNQSDSKQSPVIDVAIERLGVVVGDADDELKSYCYDLQARLYKLQGNLDKAITAEQTAVKFATGPIKERMMSMLEDLKEEAEGGKEDAEEGDEKAPEAPPEN